MAKTLADVTATVVKSATDGTAESELAALRMALIKSIAQHGLKSVADLRRDNQFFVRSVDGMDPYDSERRSKIDVNSINLNVLGKQTLSNLCNRLVQNDHGGIHAIVMERSFKTVVANVKNLQDMLQKRLQNNFVCIAVGREDQHVPVSFGASLEIVVDRVPIESFRVIFVPEHLFPLVQREFQLTHPTIQIISVPNKLDSVQISRHVLKHIRIENRGNYSMQLWVPDYATALQRYFETANDRVLLVHAVRTPTALDLAQKRALEFRNGLHPLLRNSTISTPLTEPFRFPDPELNHASSGAAILTAATKVATATASLAELVVQPVVSASSTIHYLRGSNFLIAMF